VSQSKNKFAYLELVLRLYSKIITTKLTLMASSRIVLTNKRVSIVRCNCYIS